MSVLRNLFIVLELKQSIRLCKGIVNVKFYSDVTSRSNKIEGTPCNPDSNVDKCEEKSCKCERIHCSSQGTISVAIVGGGFTSLCAVTLLKQNPAIKEIRLIDTDNSLNGPVCDVRQIDTSVVVKHFRRKSILQGLHNANIVALMDETHFTMGIESPFAQFESSCNYVKSVAECIISACPTAIIAVFTHPVTANLPLVSEICKYSGFWDPNRIIGSAALEAMRISAMTASLLDLNPSYLSVPIAGGIDSLTIVPLLSRTRPFNNFTTGDQCKLIEQLRSADKLLYYTESKGPTLSSGLAAAKFISTLVNGIKGESISIASAYVRSNILPPCQYMTSELKFGPKGIHKNFGLPKVSSAEVHMIEQAAPVINKIVDTVMHFVHNRKIKGLD